MVLCEETIHLKVRHLHNFTSNTKQILVMLIYAYHGCKYVILLFLHGFTLISHRYQVFGAEVRNTKGKDGHPKFGDDIFCDLASKVTSQGEVPPEGTFK